MRQQDDSDNRSSLGVLHYQEVVPVEWELLEQPIDAALQQRYRHDNAILLQGLLVVDEQPVIEHDEEYSALGQELQRIDHKLNLILELLSQTLRSWRSLPPPVPIRLTVDGVEWRCDQELPAGQPILLRLYLSPVFPNPFVATGIVQPGRGDGAVSVCFDELGGPVGEALEKLVFRQHRRRVARLRLRKSGDEQGQA